MKDIRLTAAEVEQLTVTKGRWNSNPIQIEHLVRIGAVTPVQEASRRGVSRRYDALNLAEIMAAIELIDAEVPGELVAEAVRQIRNDEYWPKLANRATRDSVAILALTRLGGFTSNRPSIGFFSPQWLGGYCNTGHTIIAAVPIGYILRMIEKHFRSTFA